MNTGLGIGRLPSDAWAAFRDFIKRSPNVDAGALLARGTPLWADEVAAYNAPFEGRESKAGVRRFPVGSEKVFAKRWCAVSNLSSSIVATRSSASLNAWCV